MLLVTDISAVGVSRSCPPNTGDQDVHRSWPHVCQGRIPVELSPSSLLIEVPRISMCLAI